MSTSLKPLHSCLYEWQQLPCWKYSILFPRKLHFQWTVENLSWRAPIWRGPQGVEGIPPHHTAANSSRKPPWARASDHWVGHTTHSGGHLVQPFKLTTARLPLPVPGPSVPSKVCRGVSSSCLLCDSVITSSSWRERERSNSGNISYLPCR